VHTLKQVKNRKQIANTMFDLEKSIADWRQRMLAAGIKSPVPLEELEAHLREDIEQLVKSGRSESEAFQSAVQQIGQARVVHGEFKKNDPLIGATKWKLMEIYFAIMASVFPLWICAELFHFKFTRSSVDFTPSQQASGLAAMGLFVLFAWGGRLSCKMLPVVLSKRRRNIVTIVCAVPVMLWWVVFLNFITPRHDLTISQFVISFLWAFFTPAGLIIGLPWGLETAVRKRMASVVS
jgi:hypothetical protein